MPAQIMNLVEICKSLRCTAILFFLFVVPVQGQESDLAAIASWIALDAPTGHEHLASNAIQAQFSGWNKDDYGNLAKLIGTGPKRRIVACALDAYSYAVSQITEEGYLRLHRIGVGSRHPLWDQAHEGQHLRILTRSGPVVGVSAVANGHFAAQHRNDTALITQDDLWLDVGAESKGEVAALGISLLDPVVRQLPPWHYANEVSGPRAGARVGCAALVAAAEAGISSTDYSTKYVLTVQQVFGWIGLGAAISDDMQPNELIVLGTGDSIFLDEETETLGARVDVVLPSRIREGVRHISPRVSNKDALMERVNAGDAQQLLATLVAAIDSSAAIPSWVAAPTQSSVLNAEEARLGTEENLGDLSAIEMQLDQLAERSAVPGHEGPIRNLIYNAMPEWAQEIAQVDEIGNLWVEAGPVSEATVFIAHMDEVGYEIESVEPDGRVNLRRLGGVVTTAWEGQPALIQVDPNINIDSLPDAPQMRGVFLDRDDPQTKRPDAVQAWFGMNAEQLDAAGIRIGMGVTGYKEGHRMGRYRYASRSLDDRVGSTSLLLALQQVDPTSLPNRVIFSWSVREEGGLNGAAELAKNLNMRTRRVYSIDTFVTSDTPLESPHFAYAPLGSGPVLRSIENSSMATPYELDRNRSIAESSGVDFQVGLTQGGTDGTTFTIYGAPNAGLSWPGRYSHSPAEIADLRDVAKLVELLKAFAETPLD
jgi:putative aminopeptidase